MASSYKTENYNFNRWIGSDIPEMEDFNHDNALVDSLISQHTGDSNHHVSDTDRSRWNDQVHFQMFFGNGNASQAVALTSSFEPRACLVYGLNQLPNFCDFNNKAHYNYFGIASTAGNTTGLYLSGKTLTVQYSASPVQTCEYKYFNEKGTAYIVIAIR